MQQRNPYEPPGAQLHQEAVAAPTANSAELQYATFWQRFLAYWIDVLVVLPMAAIPYLLADKTRFFYMYWLIPGLAVGLFFHVYLVKRYGGTPGKLLLKTRIALVDGSRVTTTAAGLRYAILFILSALSSIALVMSTLSMTDEMYFSLGYVARVQQMVELAPSWYPMVSVLVQVWVWSEFITMLLNEKRRAVHDFIAGTVVVRSQTDA
jgi:uncharacterized RDD family membrane protein YckC